MENRNKALLLMPKVNAPAEDIDTWFVIHYDTIRAALQDAAPDGVDQLKRISEQSNKDAAISFSVPAPVAVLETLKREIGPWISTCIPKSELPRLAASEVVEEFLNHLNREGLLGAAPRVEKIIGIEDTLDMAVRNQWDEMTENDKAQIILCLHRYAAMQRQS